MAGQPVVSITAEPDSTMEYICYLHSIIAQLVLRLGGEVVLARTDLEIPHELDWIQDVPCGAVLGIRARSVE